MKINPLQNIGTMPLYSAKTNKLTTTPKTSTNLTPMPDNYGKAMVFKSINDRIKTAVMKTSFEDKLAVGLKQLKKSRGIGNYFLAAKDIKGIQELMKFIDIPVAIKKLVILTDSQFSDTLLITKNGKMLVMVNTNDKPIVTSNLDLLYPGESTQLHGGEHLRMSDGWFEIKDKPDTEFDLEKHSSLFMQVLDYTNDLEEEVLAHNRKIAEFIKTIDQPETKSKGLSFDSVGGQDEVIEALRKNILFPIKYPDVFDGFMVSRGAILYGPPGTGKTLLAQALAAESGASVFELCATDLADKYVGESEKNCRELFQKAVDAQPSIIYFDEIDALAKTRGKDQYGDKLLAQFLSLMSDLEKRGDNVFVIGSTNRREDLDSAFTRSGRFSTLLEVKAPDLKGTRQIFDIHTKGKPIDNNVDKEYIAQRMFEKKMTGADIAATVKEAFSNALERTGIYESMAKDSYSPMMKDFLTINTDDFIKAIESFNNGSNQRNPIGYNK